MKTKLITLQFAFFLRDIVKRPDKEFDDLNDFMVNIFDAMPQMIPINEGLPSDIPSIILKSENNSYECRISRTRIDFYVQRISGDKSNTEILKDFNLKVSKLTEYILKKQEVIRFGMVAKYFYKDENPIDTMKEKFFTHIIDGSSELALRFNKPTSFLDFEINDVLEITATPQINGDNEENGIYIQRDINNVIQEDRHLTFEELGKLSKEYSDKISWSVIEGLFE